MSGMPISIGLLADMHVAGVDDGGRVCTHSLDKLTACVETFIERGVALLVNLGDAIDRIDGDPTEPAESLQAVRAATDRFDGPIYLVLGNHDLGCLPKPDLLAGSGSAVTQPYGAFDRGGVHFIVLDTNCFEDGTDFTPATIPADWGDAWLGKPQLDWLAEDLARAGSTPTVIFSHAELDPRLTRSGENKHAVRDGHTARRLIAQAGNVRAVIQGHCHRGRFAIYDGVPYVTLKAMVDGPLPDHNAFAIANLDPDGSIELIGFGDQPAVVLPAGPGVSG